jgi:hypothetical protein
MTLRRLTLLFLAILAPVARAASPEPTAVGPPSGWQSASPEAAPAPCTPGVTEDPALDAALGGLTVQVDGTPQPLGPTRIEGLKTIAADALWKLVGPPPKDGAQAAGLVRRLVRTGLFARVTPVIEVSRQGGGPLLAIYVIEHPTLKKVVVQGLEELKPEPLLGALLETPSEPSAAGKDDNEDEDDEKRAKAKVLRAVERGLRKARGHKHEKAAGGTCPDPQAPRAWLARADGAVVFPGVVWKGLEGGLDRVLERVFHHGYRMASLSATLGPDGTLTLVVDEGRIGRIDVRGVAPGLEGEVRRRLDLHEGRPFVEDELTEGWRRVHDALPFLQQDEQARPTRARPRVVEQAAERQGEGEQRRYHSVEEVTPAEKDDWYRIEGHTLVLHYKVHRFSAQVAPPFELIRHTPVTGFAPGLEGAAKVWDPRNRVQLALDLAGNVNQYRAAAALPSGARDPKQRWRFDWALGPRIALPALRVAELGFQFYDRVDTSDRWRLNRLDAYLGSLVMNRPDSDYYRRGGFAGFATVHLRERWTAGVEYRRDSYHSLASAADVWTLFRNDEAPRPTPPITEGTMGSLLLRLEYSSVAASALRVGGLRRDAERSLVNHRSGEAWWADLRTVNTVEIANPALGGDDRFRFVRLVSDSAVFLATGHHRGLKLRFRAAGRLGGDALPVQKQEALGGWSALRGYGFKELGAGDFSLLGTAEYRLSALGLFVDVGSLRSGGAFGRARTGVGATLNVSDEVHLDLAWRADDQARLRPEARLLFKRTF